MRDQFKEELPDACMTAGEITDWKAGMWTPTKHKRTSLLIGWQLLENDKVIDEDTIDFDTEDGTLKQWLVLHLIRNGDIHGREIRFWLYDLKELDGEKK